MKKLALTLLFATIGTFTMAQSFSFGPKAGINISNYTGGDFKTDSKVGYHFGGMLNFGIGNHFSIQPEVLFSTVGAKVEDKQNVTSKDNFKVSYVTVPVMLKLKTTGGFYVEAGPQVGFRTSTDLGNQTIDNFAKNLDLSLGGGIGYQSNIGLGIGVRYIAGLTKVGNFSGSNIDPDFKNSVIQASLFWAIPVVKK